jgi:hypothetical protein
MGNVTVALPRAPGRRTRRKAKRAARTNDTRDASYASGTRVVSDKSLTAVT